MSITPERLAAYADGELDAVEARAVEAELAGNAELQARLAAHLALKARLSAHFAPILEQPLPDRLRQALADRSGGADVVAFPARRRPERRGLPRWTWIAGPALAASLVIGMLSFGSGGRYAEGTLALALDRQLVASQGADAPVRILLSFRDDGGQYCRGFQSVEGAGIACRDERGWRLRKLIGGGDAGRAGEYRQAASGEAEVLEIIQEMAAGPALNAEEELGAMRRNWRSSAPVR